MLSFFVPKVNIHIQPKIGLFKHKFSLASTQAGMESKRTSWGTLASYCTNFKVKMQQVYFCCRYIIMKQSSNADRVYAAEIHPMFN